MSMQFRFYLVSSAQQDEIARKLIQAGYTNYTIKRQSSKLCILGYVNRKKELDKVMEILREYLSD